MPEYTYECTNCQDTFDVQQSIKAKKLKKCTSCKKLTLQRVIYPSSHLFVRGEAVSVGQLADRNAKKMGRNEIEERHFKNKDETKEALIEAKKETQQKIRKMNDEQKIRYIENG